MTSPSVLDRTVPLGGAPGLLAPHDVVSVLGSGNVVGGRRDDLAMHLARWGRPDPPVTGGQLHSWVREVGLTGRGGAHFPVAVKWEAALASGPGGTVVVNAAEGEPAAGKDAALMQLRPHLVIDGAMAVGGVIGAREVVVWLHDSAEASRASLRQALAERRHRGLADLPVRVLAAPEGYVRGEASAVVNAVLSGSSLPMTVLDPARPWGEGPPVLVHNAETLARVGCLTRTGPQEPVASSLVTVATTSAPGVVATRTVVELLPHETLADAVLRAGAAWPSAVLLGGYGGSWHRWSAVAGARADQAALREAGLSLGAGVLLLLGAGRDVLDEATAIAGWMAAESAGQCGPCLVGLPALADALQRRRIKAVRSTLPLIEGRGACRHPDGVARMVRTALDIDTGRER